jgi:two-component SAPR family response regulator
LRKLDNAPLRARCFGARGVWYGERRVWPSPDAAQETGWELLLLLAVHRVSGVQAETLADMLWEEDGAVDPGSTLRKRRRRLRLELKQLVPDLQGDPMPTDPKGRIYTLDPSVIASDVHQFLELAAWGKGLPRREAIAAYEEALGLYGGDLLDSLDVPTYAWLYDGASIATTLRPDYRRVQEEVRRHLADLCAEGSDEADLRRAQELYTELTGERPDDDHLWVALLRVQGRLGDLLGVQASLRRLRMALVELGQGDDPDKISLPPNVQRVLEEVQVQSRAAVA